MVVALAQMLCVLHGLLKASDDSTVKVQSLAFPVLCNRILICINSAVIPALKISLPLSLNRTSSVMVLAGIDNQLLPDQSEQDRLFTMLGK
ncbi:MAG: hypothetical protein ACI9UN_001017 [Granulosicoccus sp.]|jgi:hypothetical protein